MFCRWLVLAAISVGVVTVGAGRACGQSSSLFQRDLPADRPPIMLDKASFSYAPPPPPPKELRKHDKVGIRVDLKSRVLSDGQIQRRKTANLDALLSDWVILRGLTELKPAPQSEGDQRIRGQITQQFRALGELTATESMKYEIAGEIADIRPNGLLVLDAHQELEINDEVWEYALTGICDPADIGPGNVVLSRDIVNLRVKKTERGHIRDSYKRGWFVRWLDQFNPF